MCRRAGHADRLAGLEPERVQARESGESVHRQGRRGSIVDTGGSEDDRLDRDRDLLGIRPRIPHGEDDADDMVADLQVGLGVRAELFQYAGELHARHEGAVLCS